MVKNSQTDLSVNVLWGPRSESPEGVAKRVSRMLARLAEIDAALANWCQTAHRKRDAYRALPRDAASIEKLLQPMEQDLGFAPFSSWTGDDNNSSKIVVSAGISHPRIPNNATVDLPAVRPNGQSWELEVLHEVLRTLVDVWEPWIGSVSVGALRRAQSDEYWADNKRGDVQDYAHLGWLTYFDRNAVAGRPTGSREFQQGWLLQLGDRPEDTTIGMVHSARRRVKYRRPWGTETA